MNVTVVLKSYYLDTYNGCLSIFHHPMHTMRQVKQRNKQYKPRGPQQWSAFYSTNPANDVADLANDIVTGKRKLANTDTTAAIRVLNI